MKPTTVVVSVIGINNTCKCLFSTLCSHQVMAYSDTSHIPSQIKNKTILPPFLKEFQSSKMYFTIHPIFVTFLELFKSTMLSLGYLLAFFKTFFVRSSVTFRIGPYVLCLNKLHPLAVLWSYSGTPAMATVIKQSKSPTSFGDVFDICKSFSICMAEFG